MVVVVVAVAVTGLLLVPRSRGALCFGTPHALGTNIIDSTAIFCCLAGFTLAPLRCMPLLVAMAVGEAAAVVPGSIRVVRGGRGKE